MRKFTFSVGLTLTFLLMLPVNSHAQTSYRYLRTTITAGEGAELADVDYMVGSTSYPSPRLTWETRQQAIPVEAWGVYDGDPEWGMLMSDLPGSAGIDLGTAIAPTAVRICKASWGIITGLTVEGSNNGSTWTNLLTKTNIPSSDWVNLVATYTIAGALVPVTGVTVAPASASVNAGSTVQLTASVVPPNATNQTVTWSSSNPGRATVSANGLVTGVSAGSAVITATAQDGGYTATSAITVTSGTVPVTGVTVAPASASVNTGGTVQLTASVVPSNATNQTVTWSSLNPFRASVSASGLVTGLRTGTARIRATTQDGRYTATSAITVTTGTVPVTGVTVAPASASVNTGGTVQLTASVVPSNATNQTVTWSSSNPAHATVSANGQVTGVSEGAAVITATAQDGGYTATSAITVTSGTVPVTGVTVAPVSASVNTGGTVQLTASLVPSNATNKTVTWSSSNPAHATVSANGLVTGVSAGSAVITATTQDGGYTATCNVSVTSGISETRPAGNTGTGFFVKNGKIYDPNGIEFIPMGYNIGGGQGALAKANYANIARIFTVTPYCNCDWPTTFAQHRGFVEEAIAAGVVPMLEMHDATCDDPGFTNIVNYWNTPEMIQLAQEYEQYMLINIANEHNFASPESWRDTYISAIQGLRNNGVKNMIVLDGDFACGQSPNGIKAHYQQILDADPQHNVLFSIHMYTYWRTQEKYNEVGTWNDAPGGGGDPWSAEDEFQWFKNHNVPLILGEFAWHSPSSSEVTTNGISLINAATSQGYGFMFWELRNNPETYFRPFTILISSDPVNWGPPYTISDAGNYIIPYLQSHAVEATIFSNNKSTSSPNAMYDNNMVASELSLMVYPNPLKNQTLQLEISGLHGEREVSLRICDVTGREVYHIRISTGNAVSKKIEVPAGTIYPGTYIVSLVSEKAYMTKKILVK